MNKKETTWGGVAQWYDDLLKSEGTYQKEVILPNLTRLLNIKEGENVLDLACGQGFFSREIEKLGGVVSGIDIASELVKIAEKAQPAGKFFVGSADNLSAFKPNTFDKVVCVLAIQNIENVKGVFEEVKRVLKKNGVFYVVMNHPAFRIPQESDWGFDEKKKVQYRRVDKYLSEAKLEIDMKPSQSGRDLTVSFHRSLQYYFKLINKSGLAVTRLEEWISHKQSEAGPRQEAEDRARREIPMFLCLEIVRI